MKITTISESPDGELHIAINEDEDEDQEEEENHIDNGVVILLAIVNCALYTILYALSSSTAFFTMSLISYIGYVGLVKSNINIILFYTLYQYLVVIGSYTILSAGIYSETLFKNNNIAESIIVTLCCFIQMWMAYRFHKHYIYLKNMPRLV